MTTKPDAIAAMIAALTRAREAGEKAALGEDGGSANHDCCVVWFEGRRAATIEPLLKSAGFDVSRMNYGRWRGGYQLHVQGCGQGASMTRAAEAIDASLKSSGAGLTSTIYYRAD